MPIVMTYSRIKPVNRDPCGVTFCSFRMTGELKVKKPRLTGWGEYSLMMMPTAWEMRR